MKIFIITVLAVASTIAEPPVDNRYLPPQIGGPPSQNYGVPSQETLNQGYRSPSQNYGPPSQNYGPPSQNYGPPSQNYGPPSSFGGQSRALSGTPSFGHRSQTNAIFRSRQSSISPRRPTAQYLPPSSTYGALGLASPSQQYGVPGISSPNQQYGAPRVAAPSKQYGAPKLASPSVQYGAPSLSPGVPSQQYGAPTFGGVSDVFRGDQSRQYLPPGRSGYEDGNGEPANYSFEYMVKDEPSGNDFGHREARQGDRAEGQYYVLLPDGRKQTVDYEADSEGYKPRISYEDTGLGVGGYDRNSQHQGY